MHTISRPSAPISTWPQSRNSHSFLARNVKTSVDARMGAEQSRGAPTTLHNSPRDLVERPRKRARVERSPELNGLSNAHAHALNVAAQSQRPFRPKPSIDVLDHLSDHNKSTRNASQVLRIDVTSIVDDHYEESNSYETSPVRNVGRIKVKCYICIDYHPHPDEGSFASGFADPLLYKASQNGYLETVMEEGVPITTVNLPGPFYITADQLAINKPASLPEPRNGWVPPHRRFMLDHGLGANYAITICFETIGSQETWPPLDLAHHLMPHTPLAQVIERGAPLHCLRLCTELSLFGTLDPDRLVPMEMRMAAHRHSTPYAINVQITWSSAIIVNEQLPIRKAPSKLEPPGDVTWTFANGDDSEQTDRRNYNCDICHKKMASMDALKRHLLPAHSEYEFDIQWSRDSLRLYITYCNPENGPLPEEASEDESSEGLHPTTEPFEPAHFDIAKEKWDPDQLSYDDSPPTDPSTPEAEIIPKEIPTPPPKLPRLPTHVVPATNKPLYHTVTRRILRPGEPLSPPTKQADESWRLQEHSDIINDFSDISADEKDYMIHWDTFMSAQRITSDFYVAEALARFVKINTAPTKHKNGSKAEPWFAQRDSRRRIFGLHATSLMIRDVVNANDVWNCSKMIAQTCPAFTDGDENMDMGMNVEPNEPIPVRGETDCFCGKHVSPFGALFCKGKTCENRFHHKSCVEEKKGPILERNWTCEECIKKGDGGKGKEVMR